ncbi:hypothetical protein ABN262_23340, partial [Citrobacter youngae]|uniref:hypothetical protein n=1 Tax=Citrobacter youngae TaxID=133448 RepID=UPI0032DBAE36
SAHNVELTPTESAQVEGSVARAIADVGLGHDLSEHNREINDQSVEAASPTEILSAESDGLNAEVTSQLNQSAEDVSS